MIYGIPPKNQFGKDHAVYWDDFLPDDYINQILADTGWLNTEQGSLGGQGGANYDDEIRRARVGWMGLTKENQHIWNRVTDVVAEVNRRFFHFDLTGCYEPFQLSLYTASGQEHYTWHTDMSMMDNHTPRKLSMSILLSDPSEFEGGDFQIKADSDIEKTLEQRKGRAWFFPSWVLHRVTPVTKGVRRSLVLWVGGPPFR
jgi:PKHD-type hydroxylase